MKACRHNIACNMGKRLQYTLRGVSGRTDSVVRELAAAEGISLNSAALSLLDRAAGCSGGEAQRFHDLDALAGSWTVDPEFDRAVEAFERIDPDLWK